MSRVPDSENVVPPRREVRDSVLQTKTEPQAHQEERFVSQAGRQVIAGRYAILGRFEMYVLIEVITREPLQKAEKRFTEADRANAEFEKSLKTVKS